VKVSPILNLEVLSSAGLQKGLVIQINSIGLFGSHVSEREKQNPGSGNDGFTYFGSVATASDSYPN